MRPMNEIEIELPQIVLDGRMQPMYRSDNRQRRKNN